MRSLLSWIIIFVLGTGHLAGQTITLSAGVDTNRLRIGEQVQLTIVANTDTHTKILWPTFSGSIQQFELINESDAQMTTKGDSVILSKDYTITSFEPGDKVLGPISIPFRIRDIGKVDSISTNPIDMEVLSVEVDTTQPFKPIKPPVEYPLTWRDYLPYALLGLLILALVAALYWWLRRRQKPVSAVQQIKETKRPAHEVALEQLELLEQEELWQKGEVKTYHERLSDIVRAYIEERFCIPALESTTDELSNKMRSTELREAQLNDLLQLLSVADLAKFAKMKPSRDENFDSMDKAKKFIQSTKPVTSEGDA